MSQVEEHERALQKFFKWGETFLSSLHSFSQVNITDLQLIAVEIKVPNDRFHQYSIATHVKKHLPFVLTCFILSISGKGRGASEREV